MKDLHLLPLSVYLPMHYDDAMRRLLPTTNAQL